MIYEQWTWQTPKSSLHDLLGIKLHNGASCIQKHEVHDITANALRAKSEKYHSSFELSENDSIPNLPGSLSEWLFRMIPNLSRNYILGTSSIWLDKKSGYELMNLLSRTSLQTWSIVVYNVMWCVDSCLAFCRPFLYIWRQKDVRNRFSIKK